MDSNLAGTYLLSHSLMLNGLGFFFFTYLYFLHRGSLDENKENQTAKEKSALKTRLGCARSGPSSPGVRCGKHHINPSSKRVSILF